MSSASRPSMRERQRSATRSEIVAVSMELFAVQGFEATTIDQIVEKVGISRRSFFHYFPSKEDVVLGDLAALGETVARALESRPVTESAWTALGEALKTPALTMSAAEMLASAQLYAETPSLRARHLEKHFRWQGLLAPDIERRLGVPAVPGGDPRARAVIAAVLSTMDVAIEAWREAGGKGDLEAIFWKCAEAIRG